MALFLNRADAGLQLANLLLPFSAMPGVLALGLPRGGVPVAYEVARGLHAPLDVFVVRKLGVPGREELAMGAVAMGGIRILNLEVVRSLGIPDRVIDRVTEDERLEVERRARAYRGDEPPPEIAGRTVILVDDGLATGSSMRAAVAAIRSQNPERVVVAVPVAAADVAESFKREVDEIVCAATPEPFYAVGLWYEDFSQTTDDEVRDLLRKAAQHRTVR